MRRRRTLAATLVVLAAGCGNWPWSGPRAAPPPMAYGPPPQTTQVGSPLPPGWVWPVNARSMAPRASRRAIVRAVNMAALRARAAADPLAAVEVAPNVFAAPFRGRLPIFSDSPAARPMAFMEGSAPPPPAVDLRERGLDGPVKDQQQAGVCWSFALSTAMEDALLRSGASYEVAPLHMVADKEYEQLWYNRELKPKVTEQAWPYDPRKACLLDESPRDSPYCRDSYGVQAGTWRSDPELTAERQRAQGAGDYRIVQMTKLDRKPANPRQIEQVINAGKAIYAAFDLDIHLWSEPRHKPGAVIPDWESQGSNGHAVVIMGYRSVPDGRQYLLHNSWSTGWGDGGYAWVSERMVREKIMDVLTLEVGDAAGHPLPPRTPPTPTPTPAPTASAPSPFPFPVPWPFPAPAPTATTGGPAPAPTGTASGTPNGCAPGQARDGVFGWCVGACANGQAPIAGLCGGASSGGSTPAPGATPANGPCAAGQKPDFVTSACQPVCPSGAPRVGGVCWM